MTRIAWLLPLLALAPLPAAASGKPTAISWGKAGVAFAEYDADALACANTAYGADLTLQPRTVGGLLHIQNAEMCSFLLSSYFYRAGVDGAAALQAVLPENAQLRTSRYFETFRHAAYYDVVEQLQRVVDGCLVARGYRRFRLTEPQRRDLRRLGVGTAERQRFLHGLGSDAAVLARQHV